MLNLNRLATATVLAGLALPGLAVAEEGPYVGIGLGLHAPIDRTGFAGATPLEIEFKEGAVGLATLGYDFQSPLRMELEIGYRSAVVDEINQALAPQGTGRQSQLTGLVNMLYDIETEWSATPYIGFGAGLGKTKWENVAGAGTFNYADSNTDITWQAIAGISAPVSDTIDVTFDYRYVDSSGGSYDSVMAGAPTLDRYSPQSHNFIIGLRFNLWEPKPEPKPMAQPAPAPRPAPAPAPTPVAKGPEKFIVFFNWDKSNLTSTAQSIVNDAKAYAMREGAVRISATGHADRSGSNAYNLGLSERRAQAVKAELVRLGIAEDEIAIMWKGEAENLVRTADGVREPQNRRVEIVIE